MADTDDSRTPQRERAQHDDEYHATETRRPLAALIAAVPIVLVNALAVIGQCQWAGTHLHWGRPGQALFAGALETTALAVMYLAHTALIEGDSAWRQKAFAYLIACGSASVNWQEHSDAWTPTPSAFVFAGASLLSPILWATYSRFAARTVMREAGLIDRRAAKFSLARWAMFPRRTFTALRYSVWHSVQSPSEAIAASQGAHQAIPAAPGVDAQRDAHSDDRDARNGASKDDARNEEPPVRNSETATRTATEPPHRTDDEDAPRSERLKRATASKITRLTPHTERGRIIRELIARHGADNVSGTMVGEALGLDRSNGYRALQRVLKEDAAKPEKTPEASPEDDPERAEVAS